MGSMAVLPITGLGLPPLLNTRFAHTDHIDHIGCLCLPAVAGRLAELCRKCRPLPL